MQPVIAHLRRGGQGGEREERERVSEEGHGGLLSSIAAEDGELVEHPLRDQVHRVGGDQQPEGHEHRAGQLLDRAEVIAEANRLGLFVTGLDLSDTGPST